VGIFLCVSGMGNKFAAGKWHLRRTERVFSTQKSWLSQISSFSSKLLFSWTATRQVSNNHNLSKPHDQTTNLTVASLNLGKGKAFLSIQKRLDRFWGPPSPFVHGQRGSFSGVKRSLQSVNHWLPSSVEVKNEWSYTSARPYVFMAWDCLYDLCKLNN
jgi:hypothetical protein